MTTKTLRMPESLAEAIRQVAEAEHVEESTAMRKLLRLGYDFYVAEQYRTGAMGLLIHKETRYSKTWASSPIMASD